jgi:UDP-N-acetylmuramoyl-L-alanyl-D-glutamate--2,6-diaminopimelate ligase
MPSTDRRAGGLSLRDLLPSARYFGAADIKFKSCCGNPDSCQPGDLFVALCGAEGDSHEQVAVAAERGAVGVVCERFLPTGLPQCIVGDTRVAYGIVCQAIAGDPCQQMRTIGITGSNGKTVTAMLLASILATRMQGPCARPVGVTSSLGYSDGQRQEPAKRTTPAQPEMAHWLARMNTNNCEYAVIEASSKSMADRRLAGMQFDCVLLTNLRRDHLPEHNSMSNYRRLKARLFRQLKPGGCAVLNADDSCTASFCQRIQGPVLTFGMQNPADVCGELLERSPGEQTFLLTAGNDAVPVRTRMIGDHHVSNCLAAAAAALLLGFDLPEIARGLESVEQVPGRLENIHCGQSFQVYVDGARTPDAIRAALHAVRQVTPGRVIAVGGAEGTTDNVRRAEIGTVLEQGGQLVVLTNNDPGDQPPLAIVHDLLDGFRKPEKARVAPNRANAIEWALRLARPGDAVVILGKGDRESEHVGNRRLPWSDRQFTRDTLYALQTANACPPTRPQLAEKSQQSHRFRVVG